MFKAGQIRKFLLLSLGFGILMGVIFPIFASFFTIYKNTESELIFVIACIFAGITVGLVSYFIAHITIIKSIKKLYKYFNNISSGRLDGRIYIDGNDDISKLTKDFNLMAESLNQIIEKVKTSATEVEAQSKLMLEDAETTNKASEQIASATNTIAEGAVQQNEHIINIKYQIEASANETKNGVQLASDTLKSAQEATQLAVRGRNDLKVVVEQFSLVGKTVEFATESITNLGKRSSEIRSIIDVINGIASQTNLLALNASIEAARAGENGRGFAVVAHEIRELADNTAEATKGITELINDTQNETYVTVQTMDSNLEKINMQINAIGRGMDALDSIVAKVQLTEQDISAIYNIYQNINKSTEQIKLLIENVSSIIGNNAAYAQEVAASSEEQHSTIEDITKSTMALVNIATKLNDDVSIFKSN